MAGFMNGNPIIATIRKKIVEILEKFGDEGVKQKHLYRLVNESADLTGRAITELIFCREIDYREEPDRVYFLIKKPPE